MHTYHLDVFVSDNVIVFFELAYFSISYHYFLDRALV